MGRSARFLPLLRKISKAVSTDPPSSNIWLISGNAAWRISSSESTPQSYFDHQRPLNQFPATWLPVLLPAVVLHYSLSALDVSHDVLDSHQLNIYHLNSSSCLYHFPNESGLSDKMFKTWIGHGIESIFASDWLPFIARSSKVPGGPHHSSPNLCLYVRKNLANRWCA